MSPAQEETEEADDEGSQAHVYAHHNPRRRAALILAARVSSLGLCGYSAICQKTKVEAKLSPSSSSKTGGHRSYGKGLLGPQACHPATRSHSGGGQGHIVPRDNMGTVLAIPMATEGLELDLREGLTQICVEKGTDSASQKQSERVKPWIDPSWRGNSHEACTDVTLSALVGKLRAAGAAEETR